MSAYVSPHRVFVFCFANDELSSSSQELSQPTISVNDALDHAKKTFALRKYEQAVEHYATALELLCVTFTYSPLPFPPTHTLAKKRARSQTHAEDAPEMADVYFAYGKALLENAIAQNSVLGKEQQQQQKQEDGACKLPNTTRL